MKSPFSSLSTLPEFTLWKKTEEKRIPLSFEIEITARCNNNCRHCFNNLPIGDKLAKRKELTLKEICEISDEAVSMGALWCLITGGEPLVRKDFKEIYLSLKKKGLLVSVFTNATLITDAHINLFLRYPPRDIEVTVYGTTAETYENVTRNPGSYISFMRGINLLLKNNIKINLKTIALKTNIHQLPEISDFCKAINNSYFRLDPFLRLRIDRNKNRNEEIRNERLTKEEIILLELTDSNRLKALKNLCKELIMQDFSHLQCHHLFHCGGGNWSFTLGYDGKFRMCPLLSHPDCTYDLKEGSLKEAWNNFVPIVKAMESDNNHFLENCRKCPLINICMWCPANAYLETGKLDGSIDFFCNLAHARALEFS